MVSGGVSEFDKYGLLVLMHKLRIFFCFKSASKFPSNAFYEKQHFLLISEANLLKKFLLGCFINNSEKDQCFCCLLRDREKKPPY